MFRWLKNRRRRRLQAQPFPPAWAGILQEKFPLYRRLPGPDQKELQGMVQVFLAEKNFEGCGGFEMTEEARVLIAAQACLLLLRRRHDYFSELRSILVYPTSYLVEDEEYTPHGVVTENEDHRLGESWDTGAVVLAWDAVEYGASDHENGENLVLHEFAHQLDQQEGGADGLPDLGADLPWSQRADRQTAWSSVMKAEFRALRRKVARRRQTLLDEYGSTDPAEFFAVATECFFEKAADMKSEHPKLYEQLKTFYRQDPASW